MLWVLCAVILGSALLVLVTTATLGPAAVLFPFAVFTGVFALIFFAHLETEVRTDAVVVHFHGLWPTRRIRLDDIASFDPRRYTMWDSGGWGVHLGLAGMTYNVSGNEGVQFRLRTGSRVLVGTQRPQEFVAAIAKALEARRPS